MIEKIKTIASRIMKQLKQKPLSENEKRCLDLKCTCKYYECSPIHCGEGENYRFCGCYTCIDPICSKERLDREIRDKEEYEKYLKWADERDIPCTCKSKDYYHNNDQGGYLYCTCDTCIDPECIDKREERRSCESKEKRERYKDYLRLKDEFE